MPEPVEYAHFDAGAYAFDSAASFADDLAAAAAAAETSSISLESKADSALSSSLSRAPSSILSSSASASASASKTVLGSPPPSLSSPDVHIDITSTPNKSPARQLSQQQAQSQAQSQSQQQAQQQAAAPTSSPAAVADLPSLDGVSSPNLQAVSSLASEIAAITSGVDLNADDLRDLPLPADAAASLGDALPLPVSRNVSSVRIDIAQSPPPPSSSMLSLALQDLPLPSPHIASSFASLATVSELAQLAPASAAPSTSTLSLALAPAHSSSGLAGLGSSPEAVREKRSSSEDRSRPVRVTKPRYRWVLFQREEDGTLTYLLPQRTTLRALLSEHRRTAAQLASGASLQHADSDADFDLFVDFLTGLLAIRQEKRCNFLICCQLAHAAFGADLLQPRQWHIPSSL